MSTLPRKVGEFADDGIVLRRTIPGEVTARALERHGAAVRWRGHAQLVPPGEKAVGQDKVRQQAHVHRPAERMV